jgi:hypothetical protein
MDFNIIPDLLKNSSTDKEIPRSLTTMGELLKVSYELLEHPFLKDWKGHKAVDPFFNAKMNIETFEGFNRTVIERTIMQSVYYSQFELEEGVLIMKSKGIEISILHVETFLLSANKIYNSSDEELEACGIEVHGFRLIGLGQLVASIKYFTEVCNNLIALTHKRFILQHLSHIKTPDEKVKYLLRQKANLLQQRDQFLNATFNSILQAIEIELNYFKEAQEYFDVSAELKTAIEQFLAEKNARISNHKLLAYLIEERMEVFCSKLSELVMELFSYHDISGKEPEKVYHAFLLGLLNSFKESYQLKSNKEAGKGRFDILLIPNTLQDKGIIIEVKRTDQNDKQIIDSALNEALAQIVNNSYAIELKTLGHQNYYGIAAVFFGKSLHLKSQLY